MRKADRSKEGTVFNIQKFSVNDGPGIRTVVFFKGCPLHCQWCANPESQLARVQLFHDVKKCIGCRQCISTCQRQAASFTNQRIHINPLMCDACGACIPDCPSGALSKEGYTTTVEKVIQEVMQDEVFYLESGGGITLSGGEFFMQSDFAYELLLAAKEEGLHTCCETTGFVRSDLFEKVISLIDHIFFDVKHYDSAKHKEGTGVDNDLILANLALAIRTGKTVLPRIPVIPGFNDSLTDAEGFAEVLRKAGAQRVQLLPFHQFGENKYDLLDQNYRYHDVQALHKEDLEQYQSVLINAGIDAFF